MYTARTQRETEEPLRKVTCMFPNIWSRRRQGCPNCQRGGRSDTCTMGNTSVEVWTPRRPPDPHLCISDFVNPEPLVSVRRRGDGSHGSNLTRYCSIQHVDHYGYSALPGYTHPDRCPVAFHWPVATTMSVMPQAYGVFCFVKIKGWMEKPRVPRSRGLSGLRVALLRGPRGPRS